MLDQERHVPLAETCNQCLLIWSNHTTSSGTWWQWAEALFPTRRGEVVDGELPAQSWAEGKLEQLQPLTAL